MSSARSRFSGRQQLRWQAADVSVSARDRFVGCAITLALSLVWKISVSLNRPALPATFGGALMRLLLSVLFASLVCEDRPCTKAHPTFGRSAIYQSMCSPELTKQLVWTFTIWTRTPRQNRRRGFGGQPAHQYHYQYSQLQGPAHYVAIDPSSISVTCAESEEKMASQEERILISSGRSKFRYQGRIRPVGISENIRQDAPLGALR